MWSSLLSNTENTVTLAHATANSRLLQHPSFKAALKNLKKIYSQKNIRYRLESTLLSVYIRS